MVFIDYLILILLTIFWLIFIIRTIYLISRGVKVFTLGSKEKSIYKKLVEVAFSFVIIIFMFEVLSHSINFKHRIFPEVLYTSIYDSVILKILGLLLIMFAISIFIIALFTMGKSWRIGIDNKHHSDLVKEGIFSYSRNPIFLSFNVIFLGTLFIYFEIVFFILFIIFFLIIHIQILLEEKTLTSIYGEEYIQYKKKTRRYI